MSRFATVALGGMLWLASGASAEAEVVRVSAAASLTDAFEKIAAAFENGHPGTSVELNFAGSHVLRTQIEQGAAVDVFASADAEHMQALERGRLVDRGQVFARNRIVVAVPVRDAKVAGLQDLARPGTKVVVAGPAVPVGKYTAEVLARLDGAALFPAGYRAGVEANVVSHETNVRAVLAKVALGEADAGFVYATDAASSAAKVRTIDIPARYNVVAEYPIAVLTRSAAGDNAKAFVSFALGAEGQAILRGHGFAP